MPGRGKIKKRKDRNSDNSTPKPSDKKQKDSVSPPKSSNSWETVQASIVHVSAQASSVHVSAPTEINSGQGNPVEKAGLGVLSGDVSTNAPVKSDSDLGDATFYGFHDEEIGEAEQRNMANKESTIAEVLDLLKVMQTDISDIKDGQESLGRDIQAIKNDNSEISFLSLRSRLNLRMERLQI